MLDTTVRDLGSKCDYVAEEMRYVDAYAEGWSDNILDIRVNGYYGGAGVFTPENVSLLVSFGGPNIWVDVFESGEFTVRGYRGNETVTRSGRASDSLVDMCEEISSTWIQA